MKLYHFTSATDYHLGGILRDKQIRTTESNFSLRRTDAGPRVVWLTGDGSAKAQVWAQGSSPGSSLDTTTARLTVEINGALPWLTWARQMGSTEEAINGLIMTGGDARAWRIYTRPVPSACITRLEIAGRDLSGNELRQVFQSRARQRALNLPTPEDLYGPGQMVTHPQGFRYWRCTARAA